MLLIINITDHYEWQLPWYVSANYFRGNKKKTWKRNVKKVRLCELNSKWMRAQVARSWCVREPSAKRWLLSGHSPGTDSLTQRNRSAPGWILCNQSFLTLLHRFDEKLRNSRLVLVTRPTITNHRFQPVFHSFRLSFGRATAQTRVFIYLAIIFAGIIS